MFWLQESSCKTTKNMYFVQHVAQKLNKHICGYLYVCIYIPQTSAAWTDSYLPCIELPSINEKKPGPGPCGKVQVQMGRSGSMWGDPHVKHQKICSDFKCSACKTAKNMFWLQVCSLKNMYFCSWLFARPLVPVTVDQYQRIWLFGLFVHGAGRNM